jgi:hypothetical protein
VEFSSLGVPANSAGYNLNEYYQTSVALDPSSSNVYVTSRFGNAVTVFNIAGSSYVQYTLSSASNLYDLAFDGTGTPWALDYKNNALLQLTTPPVSVAQTITGNGLSNPLTLAMEPGTTGNIWVMNGTGAANQSVFTISGGVFANDTANTQNYNENNAVDAGGNVWVGGGGLVKYGAAGTTATRYTGFSSIDGMYFDGSNTLWGADRNLDTIFQVSDAGAILNGSAGYAPVPATVTSGSSTTTIVPDALVVDGSGNVWYSAFNEPGLRELIGVAAPTVTPLAYAVKNSLLGTRP